MKQILLLAVALCGWSVIACAQAEPRTWTDVNGRTLQASLEGTRGNDVLLRLNEGKQIAFPISRLSEADQQFIQAQVGSDPHALAARIDQMVMNKLKLENGKLRQKIAKAAKNPDFSAQERKKEVERLQHQMRLTLPTPPVSDQQFLRRIYLQIGGRIPTYDETKRFLDDPNPDKRAQLIDDLLDSEAFVSHFFNYLSDLLRIRTKINPDNRFLYLKTSAYVDWVKDQIRRNRPWDEFVAELITAKGYFYKSPATGYLLTDFGNELCGLSNTFTVFTGLEITCAQCHDHPYEEVYQMDFYRLASFFGSVNYAADTNAGAVVIAEEASNLNEAPGPLQSELNFRVADTDVNRIHLPYDYKYDDGKPLQPVSPAAYFGDEIDLTKFKSPREAFSAWLTSEANPRFTINIANRLWKEVFGYGQVEPVDNLPGHLNNVAQNYELLMFLEQAMKSFDYNIKDFLRMLYNTKTFQRQSCAVSPTQVMIARNEFHFPAPLLKRMTAEQYWDSLVTIASSNPDGSGARILDRYQEVMNQDWGKLSTAQADEFLQQYKSIGGDGSRMYRHPDGSYAYAETDAESLHLRAADRKLPADNTSFLYVFGQSQKEFIEADSVEGSIPQVLLMLNGRLTNNIISSSSRHLATQMKNDGNSGVAIERAFLSILNRKPTPADVNFAKKLLHGGDANPDYSDVIWALLNLHEFRFIQ